MTGGPGAGTTTIVNDVGVVVVEVGVDVELGWLVVVEVVELGCVVVVAVEVEVAVEVAVDVEVAVEVEAGTVVEVEVEAGTVEVEVVVVVSAATGRTDQLEPRRTVASARAIPAEACAVARRRFRERESGEGRTMLRPCQLDLATVCAQDVQRVMTR